MPKMPAPVSWRVETLASIYPELLSGARVKSSNFSGPRPKSYCLAKSSGQALTKLRVDSQPKGGGHTLQIKVARL